MNMIVGTHVYLCQYLYLCFYLHIHIYLFMNIYTYLYVYREVENGVGFLLHSLGMLEMDSHRVEEAKRVFSTGVSLFPHHSQMLLGI
jgi:hypothetical protein